MHADAAAILEPVARALILLAALALASVPASAAGALPGTTTRSDRAAWKKLLDWPATCDASWRGEPGAGIAGVWPIGSGSHLVAVDCSLFAYQGTSMVFVLDATGRPLGPLVFHIYVDPGTGKPTPTKTAAPLGQIQFVTATGILSVTDLAAGSGVCGIYSTFKFSGTELVPVAARARETCTTAVSKTRWPKLPLLTPAG